MIGLPRFLGPLLVLLLGAAPAPATQAEKKEPAPPSCAVTEQYLHIGGVPADVADSARPAAGGHLPLSWIQNLLNVLK